MSALIAAAPTADLTDREVLADTMLRPTLEQLLIVMRRFGRPSLMWTHMSAGWVCMCEMNVCAKGGSYQIRSEFGMDTPMRAARQCAERILQHLDLQTR